MHGESWNSIGGWIGFSDFWILGHFFNVLNCCVYDVSESSIRESSWLNDNSSSHSLHYKFEKINQILDTENIISNWTLNINIKITNNSIENTKILLVVKKNINSFMNCIC